MGHAEKAVTNFVHMELGVDVDNDDFNELVEAWSIKVVQPLTVGVLDNTEVLCSGAESVRGGVEFAENGRGKKFSASFMLDELPLRDIAILMVIPVDEKRRLGWRVSRYICKHVCNDFPVTRHVEDLQALHSDRPYVFGYELHSVLLNGVFGSVTGASASVENAGLLASTRVGSRRVIQISAAFMISFSVFGKLGAFFASISVPIIAALYCVFFSYVSSAGLGFLQFCNLNSFRTKIILGFSFFMDIPIPQYFREYYHIDPSSLHIRTHSAWFDDIVTVIFTSHTTMAALVALILDYLKSTISSYIAENRLSSLTARHMAAADGHLNIIEYLVVRGVFYKYLELWSEQDLNAFNQEKNTPLHWACLNGHLEVVKKLIWQEQM